MNKLTYEELEAEAAALRRCIDEVLMPRYREFWDTHFPERFSDSIAYQEATKALSGQAGRELLAEHERCKAALEQIDTDQEDFDTADDCIWCRAPRQHHLDWCPIAIARAALPPRASKEASNG